MSTVWLVSKVIGLHSGAKVSMVVGAFAEKALADAFVRQAQGELAALVSSTLVGQTPRGPKQLGRGTDVCAAVGVAEVQYGVNEVEVQGAIELAKPLLIVPS